MKDEPKDNPFVSLIDDDDDDPIGRSMAEAWHNHPYIMALIMERVRDHANVEFSNRWDGVAIGLDGRFIGDRAHTRPGPCACRYDRGSDRRAAA